MTGFVYMTASRKRGTIYIGVTNDLARRLPEHKKGSGSIRDAIQRETSLKRWSRQWKVELIEAANPERHELFRGLGW